MLQSRQFPGEFCGGKNSSCMVPLLDVLNHSNSADITVRIRSGLLEFICDEPIPCGQQIWNSYGAKSNDELLMTYGFAIQDNRFDSVPLALAGSDAANAGIPIPEIRLTMQ